MNAILSPDPTKAHVAQDLKHDRPLIACRFDSAGRFVFASSEDQSIQRWDLASGVKTPLLAHDSWVHALASTPDGQTLISGGCDGRLIWWPAADPTPKPIRQIEAHPGWINGVAVSPDGQTLASCGNDMVTRLWSVTDGKPIREFSGHDRPIYKVAFDRCGQSVVTADLKGVVKQWDVATGKEVRQLGAGKLYAYNGGQGVDYGGIRDISFSADEKYFVCSGLIEATNPLGAVSKPALVLFDWGSGQEKQLCKTKEDVKGVAWGARFHPAGFLVAVSGGTGGGHLWFFRVDQPNEFFTFRLPNTARDLDLHPDGLQVATAHHDGHLRITALKAKSV